MSEKEKLLVSPESNEELELFKKILRDFVDKNTYNSIIKEFEEQKNKKS